VDGFVGGAEDLLGVGEFLFDVVGGGLDFADVEGGDGADVGHAGGVGRDQQEDFAGTGELVAQFHAAYCHVVLAMVPKGVKKAVGGLVFAVHADAAANDVLCGEADDATGEGVGAPCFDGLAQDVFTVVVVAVAVTLLRGAGVEPVAVVVEGGDGKLDLFGYGHFEEAVEY
jgi:hypothetical protein